MKEAGDNLTLKAALGSNEDFLAFVEQEVRSNSYRREKECARSTSHPAEDRLHEYVLGWLDESEAEDIRDHLDSCKICTMAVLRIMRDEEELTQIAANQANEPSSDSNFSHKPTDLTGFITSEFYWEPQYAGRLVAAADIPKQEHAFITNYGEVHTACYWGEQQNDDPAYIWLSWKANISSDNEIRIQFINPETQKIRHEISLGTIRVGEETFTSYDLGFDPSCERWAISVII